MGKKAVIGTLPEGSVFEVSVPVSPPQFTKAWKGTGVITAQKGDATETLLNSGRYIYFSTTTPVQVLRLGYDAAAPVIAGRTKETNPNKVKKLRTRFDIEGKPLNKFGLEERVLVWRPALEQFVAYRIYRVSKRSVTLVNEEGEIDVVSGHHHALLINNVKDHELP